MERNKTFQTMETRPCTAHSALSWTTPTLPLPAPLVHTHVPLSPQITLNKHDLGGKITQSGPLMPGCPVPRTTTLRGPGL